ncbi:MAG: gliding motility-associated C-terminal domain-containing protein, partial [Bacteroidota bacterium]
IPPPPSNLTIDRGNRSFRLSWDPTICEERAWGYKVYRKTLGATFAQDSICCEMTPEEAGFQLIDSVQGWANIIYIDSLRDIPDRLGDSICYAVTAVFTDPNLPGIPITESCATDACLDLENSPIYILNDSIGVNSTSVSSGEVDLRWTQPVVDLIYQGPYTYRIYRANNNGFPAIEIARQNYEDTTFVDMNLDTETRGYNYRVEVFSGDGERIQTSDGSNLASTVFLEAEGGGSNFIDLTWTDYVPWQNAQYEVWRSDNGGSFNVVTVIAGTGANLHAYRDENLNPQVQYCYFIRAIGSYGLPDIEDPLINDSQQACDFAQDDEPPCPPTIVGEGDCETLLHTLTVTKTESDCANDASFFTLLFANNEEGPYRELRRIDYQDFGSDTMLLIRFEDRGEEFAGCYAVTITDSLGNTSDPGTPYCVDFCPSLTMSNVFTPNGDGFNDVLRPAENRDVVLVECIILDRWGRQMARTTGSITELWDGREQRTGRPAAVGTYYYLLRYEERSLGGNVPVTLKGFITLLR